LPLASLGFWQAQKYVEARTGSSDNSWCRLLTKHSTMILVLITIVSLAPKALKVQGEDKLPLKEAAIWIQENARNASPVVMSNEPLVAYYAGGEHTYIPPGSYESLVAFIRKNQVDYLVLGEKEVKRGEPFIRQLQPDNFRKVPFRGGERALVYEVMR